MTAIKNGQKLVAGSVAEQEITCSSNLPSGTLMIIITVVLSAGGVQFSSGENAMPASNYLVPQGSKIFLPFDPNNNVKLLMKATNVADEIFFCIVPVNK